MFVRRCPNRVASGGYKQGYKESDRKEMKQHLCTKLHCHTLTLGKQNTN
jgi:hypothetical protein